MYEYASEGQSVRDGSALVCPKKSLPTPAAWTERIWAGSSVVNEIYHLETLRKLPLVSISPWRTSFGEFSYGFHTTLY
jgi:hypothetical protein